MKKAKDFVSSYSAQCHKKRNGTIQTILSLEKKQKDDEYQSKTKTFINQNNDSYTLDQLLAIFDELYPHQKNPNIRNYFHNDIITIFNHEINICRFTIYQQFGKYYEFECVKGSWKFTISKSKSDDLVVSGISDNKVALKSYYPDLYDLNNISTHYFLRVLTYDSYEEYFSAEMYHLFELPQILADKGFGITRHNISRRDNPLLLGGCDEESDEYQIHISLDKDLTGIISSCDTYSQVLKDDLVHFCVCIWFDDKKSYIDFRRCSGGCKRTVYGIVGQYYPPDIIMAYEPGSDIDDIIRRMRRYVYVAMDEYGFYDRVTKEYWNLSNLEEHYVLVEKKYTDILSLSFDKTVDIIGNKIVFMFEIHARNRVIDYMKLGCRTDVIDEFPVDSYVIKVSNETISGKGNACVYLDVIVNENGDCKKVYSDKFGIRYRDCIGYIDELLQMICGE